METPDAIDKQVLKRYEVLKKLGKGAYAVVFKAVDKKSRQTVAIKKIFGAFHNATDAQRTFREIMYLQALSGHDNIIRLTNVLKATNDQDIYLIFDFMPTDLHAVCKANILEPVHKQFVIYQCLKALLYCHSGGLIHRDLKPSNLLLNDDCLLKLADFGLARSLHATRTGEVGDVVMTDYVATRWYRAPEILLGSTSYSKAVDMWSMGCIIAELFTGKALLPGVLPPHAASPTSCPLLPPSAPQPAVMSSCRPSRVRSHAAPPRRPFRIPPRPPPLLRTHAPARPHPNSSVTAPLRCRYSLVTLLLRAPPSDLVRSSM